MYIILNAPNDISFFILLGGWKNTQLIFDYSFSSAAFIIAHSVDCRGKEVEVKGGGATSFVLLLNDDVTRVTEAVIFDPIFLKYRGRM